MYHELDLRPVGVFPDSDVLACCEQFVGRNGVGNVDFFHGNGMQQVPAVQKFLERVAVFILYTLLLIARQE